MQLRGSKEEVAADTWMQDAGCRVQEEGCTDVSSNEQCPITQTAH